MKIISNKQPIPDGFKILKRLNTYTASKEEIEEVEKSISLNKYWEQKIEWRISTYMLSRIEPKFEFGEKWFITTVKCEQEIMIPGVTIERAIIFMKIYQDFIMDVFYQQGWASKETKN